MCNVCDAGALSYGGSSGSAGSADAAAAANFLAVQGATSDQNINGVLSGSKWGGTTLTYSFPAFSTQYESSNEEAANSFSAATPQVQTAIRYAMRLVSEYTNLVTSEVTSAPFNADVRVAFSSSANPTAYAYYPSDTPNGGDVWLGTEYAEYQTPTKGQYAWHTILHELGHALGLKHGQETGGVANTAMDYAHDWMPYSVMTYRSYQGSPLTGYSNELNGYAQTYMMYDIAALQAQHGANFNTNSGNTTYSWSQTTGEMSINGVGQGAPGGNRIFMTIWDGNGIDTYDFSNYTTNLSVNLTPGGFTKTSDTQLVNLGNSNYGPGNIFNALQFNGDARSLIENVNGGSGNDSITGNAANNTLLGKDGNDSLNGGGGADILWGGAGNNSFTGGTGNDLFYFRMSDFTSASTQTVLDGGTELDLIRIDGAAYYSLSASSSGGLARLLVSLSGGGNATFNVSGLLNAPLVVATSSSVTDYTTLTATTRKSLQLTTLDWANTRNYVKYTDIYNASGLRDHQFGTYDGTNGTWDFYWDVAGTESSYAARFDYYNQSGTRYLQQGNYDAGGSWSTNFDTTGSNTLSATTYYDSLGRTQHARSDYRDGSYGVTNWDPAGTQAFSVYTTYYDTQGRADTQNGTYDGTNGTWWVNFDQDNSKPWQTFTALYNTSGSVTSRWYTMDNGSVVYL